MQQGERTYPNGDRYEGELQNNIMHGNGTFTDPRSHTYKGEWKDDKMHGNGQYTHKIGFSYKGLFHNGIYASHTQTKKGS